MGYHVIEAYSIIIKSILKVRKSEKNPAISIYEAILRKSTWQNIVNITNKSELAVKIRVISKLLNPSILLMTL